MTAASMLSQTLDDNLLHAQLLLVIDSNDFENMLTPD